MKALILAAGDGDRLGNITNNMPKPLIQLLGMSLIERIILTAKHAGIREFVIVIGYLGEKIKTYLGDGSRLKVQIEYVENKEWKSENSLSVLKAKELLDEDFVLLMSDHIFDERILKELIFCKRKSSITLAIDRKESLPGDTKVLEKNGNIIEIGKHIEASNSIDTGIFLCSHKIFSYIEAVIKEGKTELADAIAKAAQNKDAKIYDITHINPYTPSMRKEIKPFWVDIDTNNDLIKAEEF
jgi:CDP-L-myo-inositol myo-inositolphosphotransferase